MRVVASAILPFVLVIGFNRAAEPGPVWAAHVGGTCVPDSATVRAGLYETAGFGVRFGGSSVGKIRLMCPFGQDGYDATIGGMEMSVIDQDGMEAGGRIRAHLHRAAKGTNIWIEIGTCDSNTSNTRTPQKLWCGLSTGYKMNSEEWYWWDVEIERVTPNVNVEFLGISLLYQVD
jgi:hypothetical protein